MKLNYPVFAIKEEDFYIFFSDDGLKKTNTQLLDKKIYEHVTLVDSTGTVRSIKNVTAVRYLGLWGFNLFKKGRQIEVDFEFEEDISSFTLLQFKDFLIKKINKHPSVWVDRWSLDQLYQEINNVNSFEDLAHLLK